MTLLRSEVVQQLLDLFQSPRYLEIGVQHGVTFLPLRAAAKVAVDPQFLFDPAAAQPQDGTEVAFHETTSDDYFGRIARPGELFDVIFLDGLHTFDQTLRDLMSAMVMLRPGGVIVVDDVIPNSYHASLADTADLFQVRGFLAGFDQRLNDDQAWMGDVFKIPFYIQSYLQQFSYATTSDNHGQTVMWQQPRGQGTFPLRTVESIGRLEFKDFIRHRAELNLMTTPDIVAAIRQTRLAA